MSLETPDSDSDQKAEKTAGLKLVDSSSDSDGSSKPIEPSSEPEERPRRRGLSVWLFVVALIVFLLTIGWQAQVASQLEAQVVGLEQELARTQATLDAHRAHLALVRGGVHELSASLEGLRALVDRDPAGSANPPTAATPIPENLEPTP